MATEIYRFRDKIAVNPSEGPTIYLTKEAARSIAKHFLLIADDIETVKFGESNVATAKVPD